MTMPFFERASQSVGSKRHSRSRLAWVFSAQPISILRDGRLHAIEHASRSSRPQLAVFKELRKQKCILHPLAAQTIYCAQTADVEAWGEAGVNSEHMLEKVKFNEAGLVPAIAQQWDTGEILMMAWMNADSIKETLRSGGAVYYSRSRKQLWRKGDTSGQIQLVRDVLLDCDGDTVLIKVDQRGVACHTGRRSCFFTAFRPPAGKPEIIAEVLMDPKELYKSSET